MFVSLRFNKYFLKLSKYWSNCGPGAFLSTRNSVVNKASSVQEVNKSSPIYWSIYLPVCLPACLSACLPACLPTYLSTNTHTENNELWCQQGDGQGSKDFGHQSEFKYTFYHLITLWIFHSTWRVIPWRVTVKIKWADTSKMLGILSVLSITVTPVTRTVPSTQ